MLPDWLATRNARLAAFFLLYLTEGLPLGFTATFVATLMRRQGVSTTEIGAFVAALYLPWSFKWAAGPLLDLVWSERLGRRRAWIVAAQLAMVGSLAACMTIDVRNVALFTAVVVFNNIFGALQDVAIDALAVDTLDPAERGVANGLMFAGAAVGQAVGGAGALFVYNRGGFAAATLFVACCLLAVLVCVSLRLRERPLPIAELPAERDQPSVMQRLQVYGRVLVRVFVLRRSGLLGVALALLPAGSYALSLTLQTNLSVEMGLSDDQIAWLTIATTVVFSLCCVAGGRFSDRFGRTRSLALFITLTVLPTLFLAWAMWQAGWIFPVPDPAAADRPLPSQTLLVCYLAAVLLFQIPHGLSYGTKSAFFMDLCDPAVAATQFTAYMAMMNLTIAYTSAWQGALLDSHGYPVTLAVDAAAGLVCLTLLALVPAAKRADARAALGKRPL